MTLRVALGFALAIALLGLAGCPASEDDPPFCNDQKCGPGVCLQFCGGDAAKDTATSSDAPTETSADASATDANATEASTDAPADAPADGG